MHAITKKLLKLYLDELYYEWSLSSEHHDGLLHIADCNRDEVKRDVAATLDGYVDYCRLKRSCAIGKLGIDNPDDTEKYYAFQRRIDDELAKYEKKVAEIVISSVAKQVDITTI